MDVVYLYVHCTAYTVYSVVHTMCRTYIQRYSRYDFNCVLGMNYMRKMDGWSNVLRYGFSLQVSSKYFIFRSFCFVCLSVQFHILGLIDSFFYIYLFTIDTHTITYTQTAVSYAAVAVEFYVFRLYI